MSECGKVNVNRRDEIETLKFIINDKSFGESIELLRRAVRNLNFAFYQLILSSR